MENYKSTHIVILDIEDVIGSINCEKLKKFIENDIEMKISVDNFKYKSYIKGYPYASLGELFVKCDNTHTLEYYTDSWGCDHLFYAPSLLLGFYGKINAVETDSQAEERVIQLFYDTVTRICDITKEELISLLR